MGYHQKQIKKGVLGTVSKITEEYEEFMDGVSQNNPVLMLVELTDLLGAIEQFTVKNYNINLQDLVKMKDCTESAFLDGSRS